MSVKTDPLPPVPEQAAPLTEDQVSPPAGKLFSHPWSRWFTSLREKVNVLNESLVNLGDVPTNGLVVRDGPSWVTRGIQGTAGRVTVTNGDAVAGNPTIDLATSGVTPGTYSNVNITVDSFGRVTSITSGPANSVPPGGTTGQVLTKLSGADYDYAWVTLPP